MLGLHHAYICNLDLSKEDCKDLFLDKVAISEVDFIESALFGIGEARSLIKNAYLKPSVGGKKVIAVKVNSFTLEAEQALLKILEEPPSTTIFFFILPEDYRLIPTLRSRFIMYDDLVVGDGVATASVVDSRFIEFLKLCYSDRLKIVADNLAKSDKDWIIAIKNGLIVKMSELKKQLTPNTLKRVCLILTNLNTRGASNKMLLEELALTLPENI